MFFKELCQSNILSVLLFRQPSLYQTAFTNAMLLFLLYSFIYLLKKMSKKLKIKIVLFRSITSMSQLITKMFYKQREDFLKTYADRDRQFPPLHEITRETDIPYAGDTLPAHRLDVYYPERAADAQPDSLLPVMINIHGGGLLIGNKEFNRPFCERIARKGFLVFSLEYRLIPDCMIFDQFQDVSTAFDYIKKVLTHYHGDPDRIYASGDSGGACLLTYTAAMQNCTRLADAAGVTPSSLKPRAVGLISGMFYTTRKDKIGLFLPPYLYGKYYRKEAFAPYVNPEHEDIVSSLPPCFLTTSHNDYLQSYTLSFSSALHRYHTPYKLLNLPADRRLTHAFSVFDPTLPESEALISDMLQFLQSC